MASDGGVASSLGNSVPTITNTGSEREAINAAANVGTGLGQSNAYQNASTQTNQSVQEVATTQGQATQTQGIADGHSLKTTQDSFGGGFDGASMKSTSDQGKVVGDITKAQNIANAIGLENTPANIQSIQSNLSENNGSFAMSGKDIMNSDFANTLSQAHKDNITDDGNYAFSNMKFDDSGNLTTANVSAGGIAFREDDSITTTNLETYNNQNLAPLGKFADMLNKGYELNGTDINGNSVDSDGNIRMGKDEGKSGEFFSKEQLAQSITDNNGLVVDNKHLLNTPNIEILVGSDGVAELRENPQGAMLVSDYKFDNNGNLQSMRLNQFGDVSKSQDTTDSKVYSQAEKQVIDEQNVTQKGSVYSDTNRTEIGLDKNTFATALQDKSTATNQQNWENANTKLTAEYQEAYKAAQQGNFSNPHYKQLAAAFVSNVSDVGSASWSNSDTFSAGTSEYIKGEVAWNSKNSVVGKGVEALTGGSASGSAGTQAESKQQTSYDDRRSFDAHRSQFNDMLLESEGNIENFKQSANNYINNLTDASNDKSDNVDVDGYRDDRK